MSDTFDTLFKQKGFDEFTAKTHNPAGKDKETYEKMMKVLEGRDVNSTLKKKFPDVIFQLLGPRPPEDGENGYYRLQMIVVPFKMRQKGLFTKFMKELIDLTKKEQKDIFITPTADYQEPKEEGGMSKGQVIQMYKKLGFEKKHKDDFRTTDTYCLYQ